MNKLWIVTIAEHVVISVHQADRYWTIYDWVNQRLPNYEEAEEHNTDIHGKVTYCFTITTYLQR